MIEPPAMNRIPAPASWACEGAMAYPITHPLAPILPDLNPTARRPRRWSDRISGAGAACRRDRSVPLPACHPLAPAPIDEAVELAQANQFGFEQIPERTELHRVVLAQHFGRGGELDRIGPPGVVSEPGFDLFDLLAGR